MCDFVAQRNEVEIDAAQVPLDPWIAAKMRGESVLADAGGERPPSSQRGWRKLQAKLQAEVDLATQELNTESTASECDN